MHATLLILILSNFAKCFGAELLDLGGSWWLNGTKREYEMLNATVPGGIFSDLLSNRIIEDPLYEENDQKYKWVGESNWTYFRNFKVGGSLIEYDNINLVFEGIDTIASIFLNGVNIGNSTNMFVKYVFDAKNKITLGNNLIEIRFLSPVEFANKLAIEQNKIYPVPPQCPPSDYRGECHINQLRKMQASFSWDWGPAFASVGIWKNVYLEGFNAHIVRYVVSEVTENVEDEWWNVRVKTFLSENRGEKLSNAKIVYEIATDYQSNLIFIKNINESVLHSDEPVIDHLIKVPQNAVKRWWPNGYGEQMMYDFNVSIFSPQGNDTFTRKIGFRTVELVQDELKGNQDSWGNTFYFRVNGIPIFAKGSNYIPLSILPERGQDRKSIDSLLQSARDSHMNMLRVWGGGVYESDYFYQKTDELGIMVWQDFMFACALYPTGEDFLTNVRTELKHQLRRIGSHTSIVVWAGNNENEAALTGNWYGSNGKQIYNDDYKKLYQETIKTEFEKILESGIFLLSSPSNGVKTEEDGGISRNPYDQLYGDDHTYIYELDGFDPNIFPIPRFSSEYGYQSYPSYSSLKTITNNESNNLVIGSKFLKGRQHHPLGDLEMKLLIFYQLDLPPKSSDNYTKTFIYYSQVIQAVSIKTETEHYRKYRSILTADGHGLTMGALYWQLNDVWVAPTWSGIDARGKWKILQYSIRDAFSPLIVVGHLSINRSLDITIVSDKTTTIDAVLSISVLKWTSFKPIAVIEKNVTMEPYSSQNIISLETDDYLNELGCGSLSVAANNCFFHLNLFNGNTQLAPENVVLPRALKNLNLQKPTIQITSILALAPYKNRSFKIELKTSEIALFVWLECEEVPGSFSENGFHLVTPTKTIYFEADEDCNPDKLKKTIVISNILSIGDNKN
ncbi:beta-mannosidase [Coccinella septempunctata]|uniref:beta-mannosidase n=1 Tax=Coccinella septempunctata TaxID=41139 RepID=UPI001D098903|nr:beta-mannosidase [Coccinella septempunctata]